MATSYVVSQENTKTVNTKYVHSGLRSHVYFQWRRSVVQYGGGQSQSGQTELFLRLHPTSMISNIQQSRFLTACRRLEKLVLPSNFDSSLSSSMMWNLQSYSTTVLYERMWHFRGSKHTLTLLHIFRGQDPPNYQDLPLRLDLFDLCGQLS